MKKIMVLLGLAVAALFPACPPAAAAGSGQALDLGEIVVTGERAPETATFFPGQVEVITKEQIKQSGARNVLDLLNALPGVYGVRDTALYGQPMDGINIRGQESFDKVAIIVNGRQDNLMNIMGHALLDPLSTDDIERIEVYKGPASVLFGSNARGGVINIITKKGAAGTEATFRQSAGSDDSYETLFSFGDSEGGVDVNFSLGFRGTGGYLADDPALAGDDNGAYRGVNNTAHIGYALNPYRTISADWRWNQFTGNMPNSGTNPLKRNRWGFDMMYEVNHEKFKNNLHLFHGQGKHLSFGTDGFDSTDTDDGLRWTHQMRLGDKDLLLLGAEYERYGGRAGNYAKFFSNKVAGEGVWNFENRYSLFFSDTYRFTPAWSLNLGYREVHDFISGWNGVPQTGLKYKPTRNSEIGVSYAKAYYTPSLRETIFFVPAATYNPDIDPEYTETYSLDYTLYKSERFQFQTSLFRTKDMDKIPSPGTSNAVSGDEVTKGVETSFTRYFGKNTTVNLSYTHLDLEDTYGTTVAEHKQYTPENQVDLNFSHNFGRLAFSMN
ncbi:MAG TPA: TonB-dependent receptor, partial [bacterium]|nr:TonB-dependent receptor [bacterium]